MLIEPTKNGNLIIKNGDTWENDVPVFFEGHHLTFERSGGEWREWNYGYPHSQLLNHGEPIGTTNWVSQPHDSYIYIYAHMQANTC